MAVVALLLYLAYLLLAFGVRSILMRRRTGTTGFRGVSGKPGSAEWLGGLLLTVGLILGVAAPVADLVGILDPIDALDGSVGHGAGIALTVAGILTSLLAQGAMGASWRIGVDDDERTDLVTGGPFSIVRNPFFAALIPTALGLALILPNAIAVAAFVLVVVAVELQVRVVEEPYLRRLHGEAYANYAGRVGRFFPGVGRLKRG